MSSCIKCKAALPEGAIYCPMCGKKQMAEKRKTLKRANGTGTVYKLSGRRKRPWVAVRNKVVLGYYERKTDALEALERISGKSVSGEYNYTFAQVFEEWKKEHYRDITQYAIYSYNRAFVIFSPLHGRKFRELKTQDFQSIIDQHLDKSLSALNKYKQLLTQMSKWAIREEIISTNFASFIKLPKEVKKEKEIFRQEDIDKLIADGSETAMIVLMMIFTGMRIGELFSLKVSEVYDTYVIGGEKTSAGRNRIIPIRSEGREYFQHFKRTAENDLLLSGYGSIYHFRRAEYYKLLDRLGIPHITPHAARHTYASWAASKGMKPEILQKILGHAQYSTTAEIYIHSDLAQLINAVEAADKEL